MMANSVTDWYYVIAGENPTITIPLQVVMNEGQEFSEGQRIAIDLMKGLGVSEKDLVTEAYMDLLLQTEN